MASKTYRIRLKKDDVVMVRSGKHKGKTGKVLATHPALNKVTVEGINIVKRAVKPSREHPQGAIIELTKPIWVGKLGITDGKSPSRVGYKVSKEGVKTRINKSNGREIK